MKGRGGRGGGGNRRRVSDSSPDLTVSFISDFIQSHTGTPHMVNLSQAHNTHTHTHRLPHTASLSHTYRGHTCSLSASTRKWLLLIFENTWNTESEGNLALSGEFVPLKAQIKTPCWGNLDSGSEQGVLILSSHRLSVNPWAMHNRSSSLTVWFICEWSCWLWEY